MRDPDREEMREALANHFASPDFDQDDAEIAMYWFASYWHGGQNSNLYSVLSTSPYQPGLNSRLETESETVQDMFEILEQSFTDQKERAHA